jgi:endo-alpha-1,4-polygalactosaminidase (GH114 family)
MMKWFILIFLFSCASWPSAKVTHWNYQLSNYNSRFEKLIAMSDHTLWVVNFNDEYFTPKKTEQFIKINKENQNTVLAYLHLDDLNSKNYIDKYQRYQKTQIDGIYLKVDPTKITTDKFFKTLQRLKTKNFLIYVANAPYLIEQMNSEQQNKYLNLIDGVSLEAELFNIYKHNKKNQDLGQTIKRYKNENKQILSVEYTVSLDMMEQYRKFVNTHDILGLITDSRLRGATSLHFLKD